MQYVTLSSLLTHAFCVCVCMVFICTVLNYGKIAPHERKLDLFSSFSSLVFPPFSASSFQRSLSKLVKYSDLLNSVIHIRSYNLFFLFQ